MHPLFFAFEGRFFWNFRVLRPRSSNTAESLILRAFVEAFVALVAGKKGSLITNKPQTGRKCFFNYLYQTNIVVITAPVY